MSLFSSQASHDYAKQRSIETDLPYAVWRGPTGITYSLWYCVDNIETMKELDEGMMVEAVYRNGERQ